MTITFTVFGTPQSAGSKKAFYIKTLGRAVVTDDNKKSKPWQAAIAAAARDAYAGELLTGPLRLTATFFFARPKSHYRSGKHAAELRATAPWCHTQKPDLLKACRGLEDAMSRVLYVDDALIVEEHLRKEWTTSSARVDVVLELVVDKDVQAVAS